MSYMAGMMIGAAAATRLRKWFFPSRAAARKKDCAGGDTFACVHRLPGRRRYRITGLSGNEVLAAALRETLHRFTFIRRIEIHALTGSLLILHTDEAKMDSLENFLARRIFQCGITVNDTAFKIDKKQARSGQALCQMVHNGSSWLQHHSAGWFDISSLLSIFFLIRGLHKLLVLHQRPSGPQMLWWAVSLLRGGRTV